MTPSRLPPRQSKQPDAGRVLFAFLGAIIGAFIVLICQNGTVRLVPNGTTYSDLAALLLTAVSVVVAIFGGVLALAALWGFNQLKKDAVSAAANAGATEVAEQIENGQLRDYIQAEIDRLIRAEVDSERMERRIRDRVDQVTFGSARDRDLEEDAEEGAGQ